MRTADILSRQIQQKSIWIVLISLFITSCSLFSIGKRAVFYNEMSKVPVIVTYDNAIAVQTGNSKQNSALLIYKITLKIDTINRKIELKGYQAVNKKYEDNFRIKVKGFSKADLNGYEFFWIDPDMKDNKLTIIK